eukprot:CAMPEP_0206237068 /NCGR_PEP_ID=MMETSP0047_2-20121206/14059_1 /ASSEMBLY_ACC=CAM_ASM_000192 /TAXON_ID=195065 /ORGANISM="Chroomonas mesostigmatica_cf, Strain CCMP1168" /LENGTH=94 /DNA_ID=CAMNT_0053661461 /DNA_START=56 /DNA_END=340 /DNA_ORIENTATION=-
MLHMMMLALTGVDEVSNGTFKWGNAWASDMPSFFQKGENTYGEDPRGTSDTLTYNVLGYLGEGDPKPVWGWRDREPVDPTYYGGEDIGKVIGIY